MSFFRMPSLGSDMERAVLIEWLVEPGDQIRRGDLIAVVETDKGAIEIEVFEDGLLERYLVELDTEVAVGEPLAEIRGAEVGAEQGELSAPVRPHELAAPAPFLVGRKISPAARHLAHEHDLDLSAVSGTGPDGAVVYADAAALVEGAPVRQSTGAAVRSDAQSNMRRAIAAAMARSKREIPHYYLGSRVDVEAAMAWLAEVNASKPPAERLLASVVFTKAAALALRKFPEFNGLNEAGEYQPSTRINVGVAIAIRGGGLVAPAIHDTDQLALDELMARLRDLTQRVRAGRYRASEIRDPTVTVTSLGDRGVEHLYGVIYPPQVACIGFGKVLDRPWSMPDRSIASRQTVFVGLSADHRVSDGRRGALLLNTIAELLRNPKNL